MRTGREPLAFPGVSVSEPRRLLADGADPTDPGAELLLSAIRSNRCESCSRSPGQLDSDYARRDGSQSFIFGLFLDCRRSSRSHMTICSRPYGGPFRWCRQRHGTRAHLGEKKRRLLFLSGKVTDSEETLGADLRIALYCNHHTNPYQGGHSRSFAVIRGHSLGSNDLKAALNF